MATVGAILAHGSKIYLGDSASPEVFAEIGNMGDFEDGESRALVNVTSHGSGGAMEYIADVSDGDEISFPVFYAEANATHNRTTGLRGMVGDRKNFRIEDPVGTKGIEFAAIIIAASKSYPVSGGALTMNITLKKTGVEAEYTIA